MNRLPDSTRAAILKALTNGAGIRATARMIGVSKGAVLRLLAEAGEFAETYHHYAVRNLPTTHIEVDEIWSFCGAKARRARLPGHGDLWTFACLDNERRFVVSWLVGDRTPENATALMHDVADRLVADWPQISTDGWQGYPNAVRSAFGWQVNYAQILKEYSQPVEKGPRRYSPPVCTSVKKVRVIGSPDMDRVTTSHVENLNLNIRHHCRRFTRLTVSHSKKAENHGWATALNFLAHNFIRIHSTISKDMGTKATPAMACGLASRPWTMEDVVAMMNPQIVTIK